MHIRPKQGSTLTVHNKKKKKIKKGIVPGILMDRYLFKTLINVVIHDKLNICGRGRFPIDPENGTIFPRTQTQYGHRILPIVYAGNTPKNRHAY